MKRGLGRMESVVNVYGGELDIGLLSGPLHPL